MSTSGVLHRPLVRSLSAFSVRAAVLIKSVFPHCLDSDGGGDGARKMSSSSLAINDVPFLSPFA